MTGIEWTGRTWNPLHGCDQVSPGCDNCYALTMARRLKGMRLAGYQEDGDPVTSGPGFKVTTVPSLVDAPLKWRTPARIFVNSMSDLFHSDVPDEFLIRVFDTMANAHQHTFQILTKRQGRMRSFVTRYVEGGYGDRSSAPPVGVLPNVHLGVSVESQRWADIRIPALMETPAAVRFISAEPLLGMINLAGHMMGPSGLDWVIAGGESGPHARPMSPRWVRLLRDQCALVDVPFLLKQWGEWAPAEWCGEDGATHAFTGGAYRDRGEDIETFMKLDHSPTSTERDRATPFGAQGMRRVGRKAAGRTLDGVLHDEYPEEKMKTC